MCLLFFDPLSRLGGEEKLLTPRCPILENSQYSTQQIQHYDWEMAFKQFPGNIRQTNDLLLRRSMRFCWELGR